MYSEYILVSAYIGTLGGSMQNSLTFGGSLFDKSDYWHQVVVRTAVEVGEDCGCWNTNMFEFSVISNENELKVKIKCIDKIESCKNSFMKTEQKIEAMYKEFMKKM